MICACSNGSAETHQLNVSYRRPATSTKGDLLVKKSLARIGSSHRGRCQLISTRSAQSSVGQLCVSGAIESRRFTFDGLALKWGRRGFLQ